MLDLPNKNKYTNFKNLTTSVYSQLSDININKFIQFIRLNFLKNKTNSFVPKKENIIPYFKGHNSKSFISLYEVDENILDVKTNDILPCKKLIGVMTTRPVYILLKGNKLDAYYVDYLCVDKNYRKKGIAPEIIQTHEYNQRYLNKNIKISIFKREGKLTGIVPITVYNTYGFSVKKWNKPYPLHSMYTILEINKQNIHFLEDFIKINRSYFDIIITPELSNIIELIESKNIFIYVILLEDNIIAAYYFRKTCTLIETDLEVLCCFASINNCMDNNIFISGFKIIFWNIAEKNRFGYAAIENISHNNIIIENIIIKTKPEIISPTAYFFYNFGYTSIPSEKAFIIN
jgi:GNAT superfamily N-acetyltransferase